MNKSCCTLAGLYMVIGCIVLMVESCHIRMSHVTNMNESYCIWISHVTHEWVMLHTRRLVHGDWMCTSPRAGTSIHTHTYTHTHTHVCTPTPTHKYKNTHAHAHTLCDMTHSYAVWLINICDKTDAYGTEINHVFKMNFYLDHSEMYFRMVQIGYDHYMLRHIRKYNWNTIWYFIYVTNVSDRLWSLLHVTSHLEIQLKCRLIYHLCHKCFT